LESTESDAANVYSQVVLTYEGETEFCDGEALELSVPEVEGYASYLWYKDGELLEDETYQLSATATSGLAVSFSLRPEDGTHAEIGTGNVLSLKTAGEIVVTASVAGNDVYEDAEEVFNTISILTTVGILDVVKGKDLVVYPNPALRNNTFYVATGLDESELRDAHIDVYSTTGALIHRKDVTGKITEISIPTPGTYFIRLKGQEVTVIIK
jgi:hypothetical protein